MLEGLSAPLAARREKAGKKQAHARKQAQRMSAGDKRFLLGAVAMFLFIAMVLAAGLVLSIVMGRDAGIYVCGGLIAAVLGLLQAYLARKFRVPIQYLKATYSGVAEAAKAVAGAAAGGDESQEDQQQQQNEDAPEKAVPTQP